MGTVEILIVFSALMALIALVTIGIDWIGKPLKHRRFIPRMYRFDDEKLPVDEYGNTSFDAIDSATHAHQAPPAIPNGYMAPPVHPPAHLQVPAPGYANVLPTSDADIVSDRANPTVAVPVQAPPRQVAKLDPAVTRSGTASRSAFTDSLNQADADADETVTDPADTDGLVSDDLTGGNDLLFGHATIAGTTSARTPVASTARAWSPGMALDTTIDDQKPSLAVKAERFWASTAAATTDSHFDDEDLGRMATGKAPRRRNPLTGKTEAMQLTGLRQASEHSDVRMRWPDEAVDPWSSS